MMVNNSNKVLMDYIRGHPFLHNRVIADNAVGKVEYYAIILGTRGPQGKSTLERLLNKNGWKTRMFLDGEPYFTELRKKNRYVWLFDFGIEILSKKQMDEYNKLNKEK